LFDIKPFRDPEDFYGNAVPALTTQKADMIDELSKNPIPTTSKLFARGLKSFRNDKEKVTRWTNEIKTMLAGNENIYKPENREALLNVIKYGVTQDPRGFILNRIRREVQERGIDDPRVLKAIPPKQIK
jgi:hypothetical protein